MRFAPENVVELADYETDAGAKLVAGLLWCPDLYEDAASHVSSEDLADPRYVAIFRHIPAARVEGIPEADPAILADELEQDERAPRGVDWPELIERLRSLEDFTARGSIVRWAKAVCRAGRLRRVQEAALGVANDPGGAVARSEFLRVLESEEPGSELSARFQNADVSAWLEPSGFITVPPPRPFVAEGLLPERTTALLISRGGVGKGFVQIGLGASVALREPFGPFPVERPRGVILVSREDDRAEVQRRLARTLAARHPRGLNADQQDLLRRNLRVVDLVGVRGGRLGEELIRETARLVATLDDPGLIILDPLGRLIPEEVQRINDQEGAGRIHDWFEILIRETGCAVVCSHHVNKQSMSEGKPRAGAATGSQLLEDLARMVLALHEVTEEERQRLGLLARASYVEGTVTKMNYAPIPSEPLVFQRVAGGALVPVSASNPRDLENERALQVLEDAGEPIDRDEWRKRCADLDPPLKRDRADNARTRLRERGLVVEERVAKTTGHGWKTLFRSARSRPRAAQESLL